MYRSIAINPKNAPKYLSNFRKIKKPSQRTELLGKQADKVNPSHLVVAFFTICS